MIERIQSLEKQLYKMQLEELEGYKVRTRIPDFEKNEPRIDFYQKMEKQKGGKDEIHVLKMKTISRKRTPMTLWRQPKIFILD